MASDLPFLNFRSHAFLPIASMSALLVALSAFSGMACTITEGFAPATQSAGLVPGILL